MKTISFLITIAISGLFSCSEQPVSSQDLKANEIPCTINEKVQKEVQNEVGIIEYYKTLDKYCIKVVPEGHIDTVIFGFVCNIPEELKVSNQKITFSGKYFELPDKMPTTFVGHEYYNLNLTAYKTADPIK